MLSYFPPFDSDSPLLSVMMMAMVGSGAIYLFNSPTQCHTQGSGSFILLPLTQSCDHQAHNVESTRSAPADTYLIQHTPLYISVFSLDAMCHRSHIFYTLDTSYMCESKPPGPFCGWKVCHQWTPFGHFTQYNRLPIYIAWCNHSRCQCCST